MRHAENSCKSRSLFVLKTEVMTHSLSMFKIILLDFEVCVVSPYHTTQIYRSQRDKYIQHCSVQWLNGCSSPADDFQNLSTIGRVQDPVY